MIFPFNYGFVPQTIAADEDALDVLVLMSEPVHPGSFLRAKPIGLMTMVMAAATPRGHTPRKGGGGDVEFGGFNTPRGGAEGEGAEAAGGAAADVKDPSSPMDEAVYAAADAQAAAARAASAAAPAGKIVPIARGDVSTATTPRIDTGDGRGLLSLTSADLGVAGVSDDKVIAVHADDPNFNSYNDIADLPPHRLQVSWKEREEKSWSLFEVEVEGERERETATGAKGKLEKGKGLTSSQQNLDKNKHIFFFTTGDQALRPRLLERREEGAESLRGRLRGTRGGDARAGEGGRGVPRGVPAQEAQDRVERDMRRRLSSSSVVKLGTEGEEERERFGGKKISLTSLFFSRDSRKQKHFYLSAPSLSFPFSPSLKIRSRFFHVRATN